MSVPDPDVVSRHPAAQWRPDRTRLLAALEAREVEGQGEAEEDFEAEDGVEDGSVREAQPLPWSPHAPVAQSDRATAS